MRYSVLHKTEYAYDSMVTLSQQMLHMRPRDTQYQRCEWHELKLTPSATERIQNVDYFGNFTDYLAIFSPHQSLVVISDFAVTLTNRPTMSEMIASPIWEQVKQRLNLPNATLIGDDIETRLEAASYLYSSPKVKCSEQLAEFAKPSFLPNRPLIEAAFDLTQRIFKEFKFDPKATDVSTPLDEVLENKRGVCQDFAHLMIGCLRSMGLACRYVSGYILTHPPVGKPRLIGADASHAWVSVYCPVYGWVDFDPTNNSLVQHEHITVAWGRDFSDVSPMRGVVLGGGQQKLKVSVTVTPQT
jgi:transglutaminase-like putative cysteine protease